MHAHEVQPGDVVEITLTARVRKVEHYDGTSGNPAFTAVEFDEFEIPPTAYGRTTSAYTVELADEGEHEINLIERN